jgi:2-hydroxychromene-2-carboxylate isomerase
MGNSPIGEESETLPDPERRSRRAVFYYDFNSPYSYLAAERINEVLPEPPVWQPIALAFVFRAIDKTPWSMGPEKEKGMAEIERRAKERDLPPVRWPEGWPVESYSLTPLRAAIFAGQSGRIVSFSLAAFRQAFAAGRLLSDPDNVVLAAAACELHPKAVLKGIETRSVKDRLREATEEAIERGVTGVPTVAVGDQLFWGDDRLEQAAEAVTGA